MIKTTWHIEIARINYHPNPILHDIIVRFMKISTLSCSSDKELYAFCFKYHYLKQLSDMCIVLIY